MIAKIVAPFVVVAVALGIAVALVMLKPQAQPLPAEDRRPLVHVASLAAEPITLSVQGFGATRARHAHDLAAEVGGRCVWVSPALETGGRFTAGEVLVRLDRRDHELALARAEVDAANARLAVAQEEANAEQATREWQRLGQGEATALVRREPQLAAARARVAGAAAQVEQARLDLARTEVAAAIDGRVRERLVEPGQLVARGAALARVHGDDAVEVALAVPDDDLAALGIAADFDEALAGGPGPAAELSALFAGAPRSWNGRVVRAAGAVDDRTQTVALIVRVDRPFAADPPLVPGLFVRVAITGRSLPEALAIPRHLLHDDGTVVTVDRAGVARRRAVEVLRRERERVICAPTIPGDERLCLTVSDGLTDGTAVRVAEDAGLAVEGAP
ncbi:MAG TPA: efflux RND transporter periplasmic adaptor subunit [Planctomycetota bacterium]|nr:efflux RND transporter periplasmic adaptor subunit [Planctomycetota bacterium]